MMTQAWEHFKHWMVGITTNHAIVFLAIGIAVVIGTICLIRLLENLIARLSNEDEP